MRSGVCLGGGLLCTIGLPNNIEQVGISIISPLLQWKKIFDACMRFLSKPYENLLQGSKIAIVLYGTVRLTSIHNPQN